MGGRIPDEDRRRVIRPSAVARRAPWCALGGVTMFAAALLLHAAPAGAVSAPAQCPPGDDDAVGSLIGAYAPAGLSAPAASDATAVTNAVPAAGAPAAGFESAVGRSGPGGLAATIGRATPAAASTVEAVAVVAPVPVTRHLIAPADLLKRPGPVLARPAGMWDAAPAAEPAAGAPVAAPGERQVPERPGLAAPAPDAVADPAGGPVTTTTAPPGARAPAGPVTRATAQPGGDPGPTVPAAPLWALTVSGEAATPGGGTGTASLPPSPATRSAPAAAFAWGTPYRAADGGGTRPGHARAPPEERSCPAS